MINLIKSENHYKPKIGDLVCEWFNEESSLYLVDEPEPNTDKIIPLVCASPNPFRVLNEVFDINAMPIIAQYKCPYTHYTHFAIVPVALLINGDEKKYEGKVKHHSPDYLMDWEFHKQMVKDRRLELYDIPKLLLGSGYTNMTSHNDGHGRPEQRRVMMDNGDALWCYFWEWYNK